MPQPYAILNDKGKGIFSRGYTNAWKEAEKYDVIPCFTVFIAILVVAFVCDLLSETCAVLLTAFFQVLIPVFALGRAQELCILLEMYWERMNLSVPIYFSMGALVLNVS